MLHTQLDKKEMDTVTMRTEEERPRTDRAETSLLDMIKSWLRMKQMNNEKAQQVSERNMF